MMQLSEAGNTWFEFSVYGSYDPHDPFLRFIAVWIAFNALYQENLPNASEQKQIRAIAQGQQFVDSHASLLATSPEYGAAIHSVGHDGVADVRTGRRCFIPNPQDLQKVLLCIYQVRCNLFHGGKHREDPRDRMLATAGFVVIGSLLSYTFTGRLPAPQSPTASNSGEGSVGMAT